MLEELFNLVKGSAQETVVNNPDVPNDQNDEIVAEATNTVASGLRNMVAGGGLQNILSLFGNNTSGNQQQQGSSSLLSNPIVNMMVGHFAGKLMSKFNLGGAQANNVANNLIPSVISNLVNKTNDPNNSNFSIESLLNSITGGASNQVVQQEQQNGNSGFNISDLIGQFTGGGNTQQSGGGGLMDIVSQLAGGAQAQQAKNGGGGLMDLIKGFMQK
ncbi:hypothetical protein [Ferruginibacter sp. HRS2-29]|uniref:hypothetical protein n=1 Tax=Ferruginibacter sp. HRS2-29 TaxID=2487334 RepID=UPI0020CDF8BB|nr:hypothetical protein [Ferruginibacter sp. HRS2-29]MCP9752976.1 hypothetical protein [Ferruginibacter sp. HRS2-29]